MIDQSSQSIATPGFTHPGPPVPIAYSQSQPTSDHSDSWYPPDPLKTGVCWTISLVLFVYLYLRSPPTLPFGG